MANFIRKTCTKLYQNQPHFVKDMTKTFWCVFRFTVLTTVHLQNVTAKFHKVGKDTIQLRQKTFTFLYKKLLRTIYTEFYHSRSGFVDSIPKSILVCFFVYSVHVTWCERCRSLWRLYVYSVYFFLHYTIHCDCTQFPATLLSTS